MESQLLALKQGRQLASRPRLPLTLPPPFSEEGAGRDQEGACVHAARLQEPWAAGLEVLAVAATGQELPPPPPPVPSPGPSQGHPACALALGRTAPDPRASLSLPGQIRGPRALYLRMWVEPGHTATASVAAHKSHLPPPGPRLPAEWHKLGEAGMGGFPSQMARPFIWELPRHSGLNSAKTTQHQAAGTGHH